MPDYRDPETRKREDHFICGLMNDKKVYLFANRLLFGLIKKSKEIGFPIEGLTKILSSKIVNNIVEAMTKRNMKQESIDTVLTGMDKIRNQYVELINIASRGSGELPTELTTELKTLMGDRLRNTILFVVVFIVFEIFVGFSMALTHIRSILS